MKTSEETPMQKLRDKIPRYYLSDILTVNISGEPTVIVKGPREELEALAGNELGLITYIGFLALIPECTKATPEEQSSFRE